MRKALLLAFGLWVALTAGCMDSPANRQVIGAQTAPVQFSGYYPRPKQTIHLFIWNRVSGQFDSLTPSTVEVDANDHKGPDANGVVWYRWSKALTLPTQPSYWALDSDKHHLAAKVKATDGQYSLTSFDSGAGTQSCWTSQVKNGGFTVMNACQSKASPEVTVLAACGTPPLPACCSANSDCGNNHLCVNGACKACGGPGDLCCGGTCGTHLFCKSGTCSHCGEPGETCCPGSNPCNVAGFSCQSTTNTCGKPICGVVNKKCCENSSCNGGLTCQSGLCVQKTGCGTFGDSCDSDEQCCSHVCASVPGDTGHGQCSNGQ